MVVLLKREVYGVDVEKVHDMSITPFVGMEIEVGLDIRDAVVNGIRESLNDGTVTVTLSSDLAFMVKDLERANEMVAKYL